MTDADVQEIVAAFEKWVSARTDLSALAVAGSWARNGATPESDLDLIVLAHDLQRYRNDQRWLNTLDLPAIYGVQSWRGVAFGAAWSCFVSLHPRAELELTFCELFWASTNPVDPGTLRVASDGFRVIVDKEGRLARLMDAIKSRTIQR